MKNKTLKNRIRRSLLLAILTACCLVLTGCNANVGVGIGVGIPVGDHGYINVGTGSNRWY